MTEIMELSAWYDRLAFSGILLSISALLFLTLILFHKVCRISAFLEAAAMQQMGDSSSK